MSNIREFGGRWIAIRRPTESEITSANMRMIRVSETEWVSKDLGIRAFDPWRHMITREISLIASRQQYMGPRPDDFGIQDADGSTIFCINYSVTPVLDILGDVKVFNFWQDTVKKPGQRSEIRVYGDLLKGGDIKISPLAFGFESTPRTLQLCIAVARALGVTRINLYNASPDHPDTARALAENPGYLVQRSEYQT